MSRQYSAPCPLQELSQEVEERTQEVEAGELTQEVEEEVIS